MYVLIVNEKTNTHDSALAEQIQKVIYDTAPDIPCEILSDAKAVERFLMPTDAKGGSFRVQCFGEFEAFIDHHPIKFKRAKTKELLAILVCHRGSMLSMGTLMSILWEDGEDSESDRSYLRTMISDLKKTLSDLGAEDVVIKQYNSIGINTAKVTCDYYDFLDGKPEAVEQYNGQFMKQYTWAEYELSQI